MSTPALIGAAIVSLAMTGPPRASAQSSSTSTTTVPTALACAQPISAGSGPTATDCLFILRVAVALDQCVRPCVCDPSGDFSTTATDALTCLNVAVGSTLPLACPCGTATTTTLPPERGACCDRSAGLTCEVVPLSCDGVYMGALEGGSCFPGNSRLCSRLGSSGACCLGEAGCYISIPDACSGRHLGNFTECGACEDPPGTTTTTTLPVGACCVARSCLITPPERCTGVYLGDRSQTGPRCPAEDVAACDALETTTTTATTTTTIVPATTTTIPAPATGACCIRLACAVVDEPSCNFFSGIYLGDSDILVCGPAEEKQCRLLVTTTTLSATTTTTARPRGACCLGRECRVLFEADCTGTYLGDRGGAVRRCPAADAATCVASATTTTTATTSTVSMTTTVPPPPMGKCCTDGVCDIVTEQECLAGGGEYQGDGSACSASDALFCRIR